MFNLFKPKSKKEKQSSAPTYIFSEREEPFSDLEDIWQKENSEYIQNLKNGNIGFARNNLFSMCEILEKESRLKAALSRYFYICYLDLDGFDSVEAYQLALRDHFKLIKPNPFLAPGVINRMSSISKKLNMSGNKLRSFFLKDDLSQNIVAKIFTQEEAADIVINAMENGIDSVYKDLKKSLEHFIKMSR